MPKKIRKPLAINIISAAVFINGALLILITLLGESLIASNDEAVSLLVQAPVVAGLSLLYLAPVLKRRKRTAWIAVMVIYVAILAIHIIRFSRPTQVLGDNLYELIINLVVYGLPLLGLWYNRQFFNVRSDIVSFSLALRRILIVLTAAILYGTIGFSLLDKPDFHRSISWSQGIHYTVDQFGLTTDSELIPHTRRARLFVDSLSVISLTALWYTLSALTRPLRMRLADHVTERQKTVGLLRKYGNDSEDYFKLWPHDKVYFFNEKEDAGLAYHVSRGVALVAGGPFGNPRSQKEMIKGFLELCNVNDWLPAFIHVDTNHLKPLIDAGFVVQKIGEEAIVDIHHFKNEVLTAKYFRQIKNKFEKNGLTTTFHTPPHALSLLKELDSISADWLLLPGRKDRGFLMGYYSHSYMQECNIMAVRNQDGVACGFLNQIPTFDSNTANFDLLRHSKGSLSNINDFLLIRFIEHCGENGFQKMNLGLCPLSGLDNDKYQQGAISSALGFVYSNGSRFYSFSGLRKFKSKYEPQWHNRFIAYQGSIAGFTRTMSALNVAMRRRH